jgi:cytochrome c oxidase subunit 2
MRARLALTCAAIAVVLTGCDGGHNLLHPFGPPARRIADLGWLMMIIAAGVAVIFYGALVFGVFRRHRRDDYRIGEQTLVVAGGIVLPLAVILTLSGLTIHTLDEQGARGPVEIDVTGHQFWWEVHYTRERFTTANELHIPVGRRVRLTLHSDDVIHSFWVPNLAGKIDMIPGRTNTIVLEADKPGVYRGQCAEYCGVQHAKMIFFVIADQPAAYTRWLAHEGAGVSGAKASTSDPGLKAFLDLSCASCHTIRGTPADGDLAPDLTHFASRRTIGAGAAPNTRGYLAGWIPDSQALKPGNLMPRIPLSPAQLQSLTTYLESLR